MRAHQVAEWMNNAQLIQLAVKYATRARKRHLGDRLTELAELLEREKQQQQLQQQLLLEPEIELHSSGLQRREQTSHHYDDER